MKTKTLLSAAVAGALMASAAAPTRADIITLYYDAFGGFEAPYTVNGPDSVNFDGYTDPDGSRGVVSWGVGTTTDGPYNGQSYMLINDNYLTKYAPGDRTPPELRPAVVTDGSLFTLGDLAHVNYEITTAGGDLSSVTIDYHLDLYAGAGDPEANRLVRIDFHPGFLLNVWETLNTAPCPNATPAGTSVTDPNTGVVYTSDGNPQGVCDDAHRFGPQGPSPLASFDYLGEKYGVFVSGFYDKPLSDPTAQLLGDFWAGPETGGASSTAYAAFSIKQIPEPATLALMGIGLAGMGFAGYRRKQADKA